MTRSDRTARPTSSYDRRRDLPRLIAVWPYEIDDASTVGHARLIRMLLRALRRERQRGLEGHWTYDLARHRALVAAAAAEIASFKQREAPDRSATQFSPVPARFEPPRHPNRGPVQISLAESGARPNQPNDLRD